MNPEKIVSAQVILPAAGGARPGLHTRITAENIHEWTPSAESIARVSGALRSLGFTIGECVGNSFAITGAARIFEAHFGTKLAEAGGGMQFAGDGRELAAAKIPAPLRAQIAAITFTPPPDFGPGGTASFQ